MESHVKLLGHPIHPSLIVLPLGLLISAVVFDIVFLITGNTIFNTISYYNIILGIIGGLLAAIFGFADWLAIPGRTRAKTVGAVHGIGNVTIVALFFISWLIRGSQTAFTPTAVALILSFAGILLALFTGWLGGEMVDRLGVGVDRGANLNASNSLTGAPASRRVSAVPVTGHDEGDTMEHGQPERRNMPQEHPEDWEDPDRPEDRR